MEQPHYGSLLVLPLNSIDISETFKNTATLNGYNTLGEILAIPLTELVQKGWFTAAMFEELALLINNSKPTSIA